jgi:hypothetical protein
LLDEVLDIEPGGRVSRWERWRTGPVWTVPDLVDTRL